jgi:hypothetical protein
MGWFRGLFFAGLFVCVAPLPLALAQASADSLPSASVAAIDSAIAGAAQSGLAVPKKKSLKTTPSNDANNIGSTRTLGAIPRKVSPLCFQPGIGWQNTAQAATGVVGMQTGPGPAVGQPSGTIQKNSNECPSSSASGAAIQALGEVRPTETSNLADRTTNMNQGTQDWLRANSVLNPSSSLAASRLKMGASPNFAGSSSRPTGTTNSAEVVKDSTKRAYISSIKLRRMMRNAPDLETRIKLRELSESLANTTVKPRVSDQEGTRREKLGQKIARTSGSSSRSEAERKMHRKTGSRKTSGGKT